MENTYFQLSLIVGLFTGAAAGYLGSFMILKRMALVGDALTHVALPGIGIAFLLNINPFIGAFVFLFVAALVIWGLEQKTKLAIETLVGIMFTASLAIGILITPEPELFEALFGDISKTKPIDAILAIVLAIVVIIIMRRIAKPLILGTVSEEFAKASGINISKINLIFLMLVAIIVALGIKVVGSLLMGALVIIPAATSKNISSNFRYFGFWSMVIGTLSTGLGVWIAFQYVLPPGPIVILTSIIFFLISLIKK